MWTAIVNLISGEFGTALAALGVPVLIWAIVKIAIGFMSSRNEEKTRGLLLFAAGAALVSVKALITLIYG